MGASTSEKETIRHLAQQVAAYSAMPEMAARRVRFERLHSLDVDQAPPVLVFPEGAWRELLPDSEIVSTDLVARELEIDLRRRLVYRDLIHDDTVVLPEVIVHKTITTLDQSDWGLPVTHHSLEEEGSSWGFEPVIHDVADLEKLAPPLIEHDEQATERRVSQVTDLLGDTLPVRVKGIDRFGFHLMRVWTERRGLEQTYYDLVDDPDFVHAAMARISECYQDVVQQYVDLGVIDLNNDQTYNHTGGVGFTTDLPGDGYDGSPRLKDVWAFAEAQELAAVGPDQHEEFALSYERELLKPFGLTAYGCCEPLHGKLDLVLSLPNLRMISVSPWANVRAIAERCGSSLVLSIKPDPSVLVGPFDPERARSQINGILRDADGSVFQIVLKDTHTCECHPERFGLWTQIARESIDRWQEGR